MSLLSFVYSASEVAPARPCVICGCARAFAGRPIPSRHGRVPYSLYHCADCDSAFFDAREHPADLDSMYDELSVSGGHTTAELVRSEYWDSEVARTSRLCRRPVRSVLDVGCRTGDLLLHWPDAVRRCGVEISGEAARVARRRGLDVVQSRLEDRELGQFDVVSCYAILEHLPEPRPALRALADAVAPSGVLAIAVPALESAKAQLLYRLHRPWHQFSPPEHFCYYSQKFLDAYFSHQGLDLAERRFTSGGMFNPFRGLPIAEKAFSRALTLVERRTPLTRWPIFDHMYRYYVRR